MPFSNYHLFIFRLFPLLFLLFHYPIPSHFSPSPVNRPPNPIFGLSLSGQSELANVRPPYCSKSIVTVAQSSRLTRRAASSHPNSSLNGALHTQSQLTLNIGVGQSVCFKMQSPKSDSDEENTRLDDEEEEVISEAKSNFSFIVSLRRRNPPMGVREKTKMEEKAKAERMLHSITVLDLEQYHAITERYRFAIPQLETKCICECESGIANCAAEKYKYGKCGDDEADEISAESDNESAENKGLRRAGRARFGKKGVSASSATVCHRTFFANQPTGRHCSSRRADQSSSSSARLCCQLRFVPYRNRHFTALRLENAISSVLVQYTQWLWRPMNGKKNGTKMDGEEEVNGNDGNGNKWKQMDRRRVRIQLDGSTHSTVLNDQLGLKLSVMGINGAKSAGAQLDPGVYFVENKSDKTLGELIGQIPVNRITEHDFHKLGWFRLDDERGHPFVQSGDVFMDKIHHARVEDCAEQRYRSVLDASYYVNADNNDTTQFRLADPLSSVHKWIKSARVLDAYQRIALVQAREGLSLEISLATKPRSESKSDQKLISFVHNSSRLGDFTAMLVIDRFSNSLLNLTLFNSSGVLNGFLRNFPDLDGSEIDGFSINAPSDGSEGAEGKALISSVLINIKPYPLASIHVICLRPDDAELSMELCRPVQSIYHELEVNTVRNEWNDAVGDCPKCNRISAEGFAKYLNPANWLKGIGSASDALMLVSDLFGYFVFILLLYFVIFKIALPLLGCCCLTPSCPTSKAFCKNSNK